MLFTFLNKKIHYRISYYIPLQEKILLFDFGAPGNVIFIRFRRVEDALREFFHNLNYLSNLFKNLQKYNL